MQRIRVVVVKIKEEKKKMKSELVKTEELTLPKFNQPTNLDKAAFLVNKWGKNIHEHAYLVGKILNWVKEKGIKHGEFVDWIEKNVWFDRTTASRYMKFTKQCDERGFLIEYSPRFQMLHGATNEDLEIPTTPKGKYNVIIIDPPWPYGTQYDSDTRRVASPYPEMSIDELKTIELPIAPDCSLWLWTTHKFLFEALGLLTHWGFEYKLTLAWDKQKLGMGEWLRCQTEFCLLGIKGKPSWKLTNQRDFVSEARKQNSRKPDSFYTMVKTLCPGKRIDYFSREKRDGYEQYGNQTTKF